MKKFFFFLILLCVSIVLFSSCENSKKKANITCYKVLNPDTSDPCDYIYFYVWMENNTYESCRSYTPVSNFSGINWTRTSTNPKDEFEPENIEEQTNEGEIELEEAPETNESSEQNTSAETENTTSEDESGSYDAGSESSGESSGSDGGDAGGGD